jgi:hypothetical protein
MVSGVNSADSSDEIISEFSDSLLSFLVLQQIHLQRPALPEGKLLFHGSLILIYLKFLLFQFQYLDFPLQQWFQW